MPDYCAAYTGHAYTDFSQTGPKYVATPEKGGYWVEAKDYERAQADLQLFGKLFHVGETAGQAQIIKLAENSFTGGKRTPS